jgi:hypothetical protein
MPLSMHPGLAAAALLVASPGAHVMAQQTSALTVMVHEEGTGTALDGVSVELMGTSSLVTDRNGRVRFTRLATGRYTLLVRALGHESHDQPVMLRSDTTITVVLPVSVIPLDPIQARARTYTLRGQLIGGDTKRAVPDADVVGGGNVTRADDVGFFKVKRLPAADTIALEISGMGYLTKHITVAAMKDTTIKVVLDSDPIAQAMIAAQLKRLELAVRGTPFPMRTLNRADVLRDSGSMLDILKYHGVATSAIGCLVVDNRVIHVGPQYLDAYVREGVERIHLVRRGRTYQVYLYTYSWVRRVLPGLDDVPRHLCL